MAATSTAFAATCGSATVAATARGDASKLSSGNAFRTTSMVQFAPVRTKKSSGVVSARAALSEDSAQKSIQRDVIVSIIAAGAALGFTVSAVDGAFASPIDMAKSKFSSTVKSAKNAAPTLSAPSPGGAVEDAKKGAENVVSALPSAPDAGGVVEDAKKGVENVASDLKDRIDGIFGKNRPGPLSRKSIASTNGGAGSALGDAGKRISSFGKNPIAENIAKGTEQTATNIATVSPKPNSQRVDEATAKVGKIGSDLQNKGSETISEGKGFFNDKAQGSIPKLPNLIPQLPEVPGLPTPDTSKLEDLKSGVQSKAGDVKRAAESALPK